MSAVADLCSAPLEELLAEARRLRSGPLVTYSPKVFVPLTTLCRDVCGYCTFARPPRRGERAFMTEEEVLAIARAGAAAGCREALFTLGDKPELRYEVAREELRALGCETTLEYLERCARLVLEETGLLPHLNPGVMTRAELEVLRPVSASMGIMLETTAERLGAQGRAALGLAGQDPGSPARDDPARGRARDPVHERDPHRHRRDARGADRRAARPAGARRGARARPGGHRPELPREARHAHGLAPRAVARRPPLDDRGRADPARPDVARAGAAEPRLRRLPAPARRRHRRLGRRLAGDDRPRQPRGAVAGDRAARGGDALAAGSSSRRGSRSTPSTSPSSSAGSIPRSRRTSGAPPTRPGSRATTRGRRASRSRCRSSSAATRRRSSSTGDELGEDELTRLLEARGDEAAARLRRGRPRCAARSAATRSPTSSRGTSSTRTSATSAAASARSRRASSRRTCAARRTSSRSTRSSRRAEEAWERGATEVCLQGGIHPAFTGDYYAERRPRDQGRRPGDPRARVLGARGLAGRRDARALARRLPRAARATSGSARCPGRPPRCSTTRCGA